MNKMELIRDCKDSRIYEYIDKRGHYIVKEILTPMRMRNMQKEIKICQKIKHRFPDFPCVIPKSTEIESVFYQEYIEGNHYLELALDSKQKKKIVEKLIFCIDRIEMIDVDEQDYITGQQWKEYLRRIIEERVDNIIKINIMENRVIDNIFAWINRQVDSISNMLQPVYVHNDLNKENIIVNCNKKEIEVYLIDFERVTVADPLKEISKLVWLFRSDTEFGDIFWKEYCINHNASLEVLKAYWVYDILYHIEKYDDLIQISGWEKYLEEELGILSRVTEDDFKIW